MKTYNAYDTIHELALEQHGVFTAEQARAVGVKTTALVMMVRRGRVERLAYSLYPDRAEAPRGHRTSYTYTCQRSLP